MACSVESREKTWESYTILLKGILIIYRQVIAYTLSDVLYRCQSVVQFTYYLLLSHYSFITGRVTAGEYLGNPTCNVS